MTSENDFLSVESVDKICAVSCFFVHLNPLHIYRSCREPTFPVTSERPWAMLFPMLRGQGRNAAQKSLSGLLLADNFRLHPLVFQEEEELAFPRE